MAHFARVDENGVVTAVHTIKNDVLEADGEFPDSEASGQAFQESLGFDGTWLQCSYNGSFRHAYPGVGWSYDSVLDAFIMPQPFASWSLDQVSLEWVAPVEKPEGLFFWDEEAGAWVKG